MVEKLQRQTTLKSQFFKETICSLCSITFGVVECTYTKKYCCKLCYKAICLNCSGIPADSSNTKTFDLICKSCFSSTVPAPQLDSKKIAELYSNCLTLIQDLQKTKAKINSNNSKSQSYQQLLPKNESEDLNFLLVTQKKELFDKTQDLKLKIDSVCAQIEEKETLYFEAETFLMDEKKRIGASKKKMAELYKTLASMQNENIQLAKTLDLLERPQNGRRKSESQILREIKMRKEYEKMLETQRFYCEKNDELTDELEVLEKRVKGRDEELEKIEGEIKDVDIEGEVLKELNETLEEHQGLIKKLKQELEKSKNTQITDSKCKCVVT